MAAQFAGDALWDPAWTEADGERTIRARSASPSKVNFYCSWFCPFAQRAWIALEEKGVDYRYVEINPYEVDAAKPGGYTKLQLPMAEKRAQNLGFVLASPRGLVPALDVAGGERLCESLPLVEFVDERFGGPDLLPRGELHAYARGQCRRWASEFDQRVQKPYYLMLMAQDPDRAEAFRESLVLGCRSFARAMGDGGPFFLGADFGFVEVAAAPFWGRMLAVGGFYRDLRFPAGADDDDFKRLEVWWAAVRERPSVRRTLVCEARLVASYSDYATDAATSNYAQGARASLSPSPVELPMTPEEAEFAQIVAAAKVKVLRVGGLLLGAFCAGYALGRRRRPG